MSDVESVGSVESDGEDAHDKLVRNMRHCQQLLAAGWIRKHWGSDKYPKDLCGIVAKHCTVARVKLYLDCNTFMNSFLWIVDDENVIAWNHSTFYVGPYLVYVYDLMTNRTRTLLRQLEQFWKKYYHSHPKMRAIYMKGFSMNIVKKECQSVVGLDVEFTNIAMNYHHPHLCRLGLCGPYLNSDL